MFTLWLLTGVLGSAEQAPEPQLFPSGWYYWPAKKKKAEPQFEAEQEIAEAVVEVAARVEVKLSPKQVERIAAAMLRRIEAPSIDIAAAERSVAALQSRISAMVAADAARKEIERMAGQMAVIMAIIAIAKQQEDDEDLLLLAA